MRVKDVRELLGYKRNLASGPERSAEQTYSKADQEVIKKMERRLSKVEEKLEGVEGRNDSMWKKFMESGFFGGS